MNKHCTNCGSFCPSGTLDNGLCSDCNLVGARIQVAWGKFGGVPCLVDHVSRTGTLYARRWNAKQKRYTVARPLDYYKGWYRK